MWLFYIFVSSMLNGSYGARWKAQGKLPSMKKCRMHVCDRVSKRRDVCEGNNLETKPLADKLKRY